MQKRLSHMPKTGRQRAFGGLFPRLMSGFYRFEPGDPAVRAPHLLKISYPGPHVPGSA